MYSAVVFDHFLFTFRVTGDFQTLPYLGSALNFIQNSGSFVDLKLKIKPIM